MRTNEHAHTHTQRPEDNAIWLQNQTLLTAETGSLYQLRLPEHRKHIR